MVAIVRLLSLLLTGLLLGAGCGSFTPAPDVEIEHLRAFAKLYGYVRYFHPSDEASTVDWDRFAIHGARSVRGVRNADELQRTLENLFLPIAPTLQIFVSDEDPPELPDALTPSDTAGLEVVVWQHKGFGFANPQSVYQSRRLNRFAPESEDERFGVLTQAIDATLYRGKRVKLVASAKKGTMPGEGQVQLWLRVDRPDQQMGFFENMDDRPITSTTWAQYKIEGSVAEDALHIVFGGFLGGDGEGWLDDFQLLVESSAGDWDPVPVANASFEAGPPDATPEAWFGNGDGYRFASKPGEAVDGMRAGHITSDDGMPIPGALFREYPHVGDVFAKSIGAGLSVQLPLALYSRDGQTLGRTGGPSLSDLTAALEQIHLDQLTPADQDLRIADVVIAWNVLQHFYPYFDVIDTDWDEVLSSTLADAIDDADTREFLQTLRLMIAQLHDGHGGAYHEIDREDAWLPFRPAWVEDRLAVVAAPFTDAVQLGDVIVSIDGITPDEYVNDREQYVSGAPQWKSEVVFRQFGRGIRGTEHELVVERGGERITVQVARNSTDLVRESRPNTIEEIEDGIYYVDLTRVEMAQIQSQLDEIARARGVIFDHRGYSRGIQGLLTYLTDVSLRSVRWSVPQIIYPDHENLAGYDTTGRWYLPPSAPRFQGKAVFLTDASAISYAEAIMGIVEHYRLGEIVGSPTAGANGNVVVFSLPGGFRVAFTGMRVLKHDGSQHHLIGIRPTVPVERTIEGVRAGRDEVLERALAIVREVGG